MAPILNAELGNYWTKTLCQNQSVKNGRLGLTASPQLKIDHVQLVTWQFIKECFEVAVVLQAEPMLQFVLNFSSTFCKS